MSLTGKVAIVTGGAKGIGYAIAADLARRGAAILIADLEGADAAARRLRDEGHRATAVKVDVASEADTAAMAKAATAELGGADILVNNAAIFSTLKRQPFEEIDPAEWRRMMEVNTLGIFLCCRAVLPALQGARRRTHRQHLLGRRLQGQSGHGALRREQGRGGLADARRSPPSSAATTSSSTAWRPGFTLSEGVLENPDLVQGVREVSTRTRVLARDMTPADIVGAVAFFAGADSAFITGQTIVVDGGAYFH